MSKVKLTMERIDGEKITVDAIVEEISVRTDPFFNKKYHYLAFRVSFKEKGIKRIKVK